MKSKEIMVREKYVARVGGRETTVRVDRIRVMQRGVRKKTVYDVCNLRTGRSIVFRSARPFVRPATISPPFQAGSPASQTLKRIAERSQSPIHPGEPLPFTEEGVDIENLLDFLPFSFRAGNSAAISAWQELCLRMTEYGTPAAVKLLWTPGGEATFCITFLAREPGGAVKPVDYQTTALTCGYFSASTWLLSAFGAKCGFGEASDLYLELVDLPKGFTGQIWPRVKRIGQP